MTDDIIKLLTKVYYDMGDCYKHIISFYEKEKVEDINLEKFIRICEKYLILSEPSVFFKFLDCMDIKVCICPVINSNEWSYRIYNEKEINIVNDFKSRSDATIGAIESAFNLYFKKLKKTEKINDN